MSPNNSKMSPNNSNGSIGDATSRILRDIAGGCGGWVAAFLIAAMWAAGALAQDDPPDGDVGPFPVSRVQIDYEREVDGHPSLAPLLDMTIDLRATASGYVAAGKGQATHTVALRDLGNLENPKLYGSAVLSLLNITRDYLGKQGLAGVIVQPHEEDIDSEDLDDRRDPGNQTLRVVVKAAKIGQIRVLPSGEREQMNAKVVERITGLSPLQTGELFRPVELDDYLYQLNRHPGRRVDVAIAPESEPGSLTVDYLVNENKPWFVFFQLSNTGTETTNEWRERFGFVHNQFTGHDDILSIDYVTAGFTASHSAVVSYEAPLLDVNGVRWRVDGSGGAYDASQVGQAEEDFNGDQWDASARLIINVFQSRNLFIDVFAGARVQYVKVENKTFQTQGDDYFFLPFVGFSVEQFTDISSTQISVSLEGNLSDVAGTNEEEIQKLGRSLVEKDFVLLRWSMAHSFYLEPLFDRFFGQGETSTLAHEIVGSFRGQYTFDERVIPQFEQVAGGRYSVRGYDESMVAGDAALVFSLEYRFHFPRILSSSREPMDTPLGPFKFRPQEAYDRPDWDLVLRAFVDVGRTVNAKRQSFEQDETLVGVGLGIELLIKKNVSIQLDWGVALEDAGIGSTRVDAGDSRLHLVVTLLY